MSNLLNNTIDLEKILNEVEGIDELIAQIKDALSGKNSGSEGGNTPSTPTLISFTIGGTSYQAEEGMTWAEWVESNYNTSTDISVNSNNNKVGDTGFGYYITTDLVDMTKYVSSDDTIIADYNYVMSGL